MNITDNSIFTFDPYQIESINDFEERASEASLHIIIQYCVENKCSMRSLKEILIRYIEIWSRTDSYKEIKDIILLYKIIDTINILNSDYYIYSILHPDTKKTIYVGKGFGDCILAHEIIAKINSYQNDKLRDMIRNIKSQFDILKYEIVDAQLTKGDAFWLYKTLIGKYKNNKDFIMPTDISMNNPMLILYLNINYYSDDKIEKESKLILSDIKEYLRSNSYYYDSYDNQYQMDGFY